YTARAAKKGVRVALALKRIKGITARVARQLFTTIVTPIVNYVFLIWSISLIS
ncbi:uncharacterized protein K441DRAFT_564549, partial [Cenococcum geophilum 1.58]|uniref:uncharacterized protein n=1 Tax=Cenococcum geophilum 1.58 TaxID=794803 RepID=UPI00358F2CC6